MDTPIRLKIVSGGRFEKTRVIDLETGRDLGGLIGVSWTVDRDKFLGIATIAVQDVGVEIESAAVATAKTA